MKKLIAYTLIIIACISSLWVAQAESSIETYMGNIDFGGRIDSSDMILLLDSIIEMSNNPHDARTLCRIISSEDTELTPGMVMAIGDVDMSGTLTVKDAVQLLRYLAKYEYPVGKTGIPVTVEATDNLLTDKEEILDGNTVTRGIELDYISSSDFGKSVTFDVKASGFQDGFAGATIEIPLPHNVIDAKVTPSSNFVLRSNITDDKRLIFTTAFDKNIVTDNDVIASVTLNLSEPFREPTVIGLGGKSEIIAIDDSNETFIGGRLVDGDIRDAEIEIPAGIKIISPPDVDTESGIVPYGTVINIQSNGSMIGYSINNVPNFAWFNVQIPLYEDTVLEVWSAIDVLLPEYEYEVQRRTYTYTIDKDTIPQSSPSPEPDEYPYIINQLNLETTSGEPLNDFPERASFIVDVNFTKMKQRDNKDYIFIAVYDEQGALLSLDYVKAKFVESEEYDVGFYISPQDKIIGKVKAFVWSDFNSAKPLAETVSLS